MYAFLSFHWSKCLCQLFLHESFVIHPFLCCRFPPYFLTLWIEDYPLMHVSDQFRSMCVFAVEYYMSWLSCCPLLPIRTSSDPIFYQKFLSLTVQNFISCKNEEENSKISTNFPNCIVPLSFKIQTKFK